jgi:SAM-dependent methyltransferase
MGRGTRYPHVEQLLRTHYRGGRTLEIGAGGAVYRDLFEDYVGIDLPTTSYAESGDLAVFCDTRALPFRSESFDFAFVVAALFQISTPERACREVGRCLRKGGVFLVFDYTIKTKRELLRKHLRQNDPMEFAFWRAGELESCLLRSGFHDAVRLEEDTKWNLLARWVPAFVDWRRAWLIVKAEK